MSQAPRNACESKLSASESGRAQFEYINRVWGDRPITMTEISAVSGKIHNRSRRQNRRKDAAKPTLHYRTNQYDANGYIYEPIQPIRFLMHAEDGASVVNVPPGYLRYMTGKSLIVTPVASAEDAVCDAVLAYDVPALGLLLQNGGDANSVSPSGFTPLACACEEDIWICAHVLLASGANPSLCVSTGASPLHIAAGAGSVHCVQLLLEAGAPVNSARPKDGCTPLYLACMAIQPDVVDALCNAGAAVEQAAFDGMAPLHALCDAFADPDAAGSFRPANSRAPQEGGRESCLECLLAAGADVNLQRGHANSEPGVATVERGGLCLNITPIVIAAAFCQQRGVSTRFLEILLEAGATLQYEEGPLTLDTVDADGRRVEIEMDMLSKELETMSEGGLRLPPRPQGGISPEAFAVLEMADAAHRLNTRVSEGCVLMELTGLQSSPELNNCRVRVRRYDFVVRRFEVVVEGGSAVALRAKAENLVVVDAVEGPRSCKACGESKSKTAYTSNQWKKPRGKRRCRACQTRGGTLSLQERSEHEEREQEAAEMAALHAAQTAAELKRVAEELAKRNADEPSERDCPVCFESFEDSERCYLPCNPKHWLCKQCLERMEQTAAMKHVQNPGEQESVAVHCPLCRERLATSALNALLKSSPIAATDVTLDRLTLA